MSRKNNLAGLRQKQVDSLAIKMKAFLQVASSHYKKVKD
jgi:hypothetical protein